MDMNKGIDAQVSDRVDAYRGQPQQLMQMYQQNKELVDLLALQKLKSEKESAKRQIEMQMQQQPGTVAQQREQEVMQMTKDELAKQTQGVLQRKQQQQQVNMQRAAKGGIRALAQNRPAPAPAPGPTAMMASGGIVAFQEGGSAFGNSAADLSGYGDAFEGRRENTGDAIRQYYADFGITNQDQWDRTPADVKKRIISAVRAKIGTSGVAATFAIPFAELNDLLVDPFKAISNIGIAASNTGLGSALGLSDPRNPNELYQYNTERKRTQDTISANIGGANSVRNTLPSGPTVRSGEYVDPAAPKLPDAPRTRPAPDEGTGIAALPTDNPQVMPLGTPQPAPAPATEAEAEATATTAAPTQTSTDKGIASLGAGSMGGAENALMRGVKIGEDVLGRDEKAARYAEMEAQLAELDEELNDPEAERRQQLQAFLIGTAGAGNIGYAMAGGAAASINLENQQKRNRRDRMLSRIQLGERGMTLDSETGKAALNLGNTMFQDFNANKRTAISASATLEAARLRQVTADADRAFEREKQEDTNAYQLRTLELEKSGQVIEQARNEELSLSRRTTGILTATNDLLKRSEDIYKMAADRFDLEGAAADLSMLEPGDEGYDAARAKFGAVSAEADAWATQYLERLGVNDRLTELEREYYELAGVDNMPGLNPDDILDVQKQGE